MIDTSASAGIAPHVQQLVEFFEQLKPRDLDRLPLLYAADARFKDPFNDVKGIPDIHRIFDHMFETLDQPAFTIVDRIEQGRQCFLTWEFRFRFKRLKPASWQTIRGGTHLVFGDDGRVRLHRDYWDAAEELYEKLPAIGSLMRWLKKQASR